LNGIAHIRPLLRAKRTKLAKKWTSPMEVQLIGGETEVLRDPSEFRLLAKRPHSRRTGPPPFIGRHPC
jgi:hypothetical protein